jgi:hypothetical protein
MKTQRAVNIHLPVAAVKHRLLVLASSAGFETTWHRVSPAPLAHAAGPPGSVQLADLQALQQAPAPTSLHTAQPLPLPPNLASLPPHVLRDYSPITRAGSAGSVGSEVPLLGELKTA